MKSLQIVKQMTPKTKELQTFYRKVNDVRKYPNSTPLHGFTQQKLCAIEHRVMYDDYYWIQTNNSTYPTLTFLSQFRQASLLKFIITSIICSQEYR